MPRSRRGRIERGNRGRSWAQLVREELEGDAIGIAEAHIGAVMRILDVAMLDPEFVEPEPRLSSSSRAAQQKAT